MKKLPEFIHAHQTSFEDARELIICTRNDTYFEVVPFASRKELREWAEKNAKKLMIFRSHEKQNFILKYRGGNGFKDPDDVVQTIEKAVEFYERTYKKNKRSEKINDAEKLIDYIVARMEERKISRYSIWKKTGIDQAMLMRYLNKSIEIPADRLLKICDAVEIKYRFR